jgi:hypothetical protein
MTIPGVPHIYSVMFLDIVNKVDDLWLIKLPLTFPFVGCVHTEAPVFNEASRHDCVNVYKNNEAVK